MRLWWQPDGFLLLRDGRRRRYSVVLLRVNEILRIVQLEILLTQLGSFITFYFQGPIVLVELVLDLVLLKVLLQLAILISVGVTLHLDNVGL